MRSCWKKHRRSNNYTSNIFRKSQTQEELVLEELEMVREVTEMENKEGLKHHQEIIMKANAKINFRNKEIKSLKNE